MSELSFYGEKATALYWKEIRPEADPTQPSEQDERNIAAITKALWEAYRAGYKEGFGDGGEEAREDC